MDSPPVQASSTNIRLRCIVKLGGAAITCKNELEKINAENLQLVASQLREAMAVGAGSPEGIFGMDWSRRPGHSDVDWSEFSLEENAGNCSKFVVVHGAALLAVRSSGRLTLSSCLDSLCCASKSGVHKGGLQEPLVRAGFVATRISVSSLNLEVVRALAREGIPSIGMPPFSCGWRTCGRKVYSADISPVERAIESGFIPGIFPLYSTHKVLHGDAVLDNLLGCTILSGDVIISYLAEQLRPQYVVFLTDVSGVYDRPPADPDAVLLKEIAVNNDGSWSILNPAASNASDKVEFSIAAHDTTGGMVTKITEAALIAKHGVDVFIVKAGTVHSLKVLKGELTNEIPEDWIGTHIRYNKKHTS